MLAGFLALFMVGGAPLQAAWFWGNSSLVTINDKEFSQEDFKNWWQQWREEDSSFPESLDPFIDWHLLAHEAEQMELYNEPTYRQKISIFLKARTLLMYKSDKISSRIKITDEMLKKRYEEKYLPRLNLHVLYFNDKDKADAAFSSLKTEKISFKDFFEEAQSEEDHSVFFEEKIVRMTRLDKEWRQGIASLAIGEISEPFAWRHGFVIVYHAGEKGGDEEDFQKFKKILPNEIRDEMENDLTRQLVEELKEKYEVTVDWDVFNAVEPEGENEKLLDKTLITIDNKEYSTSIFLEFLKKERSFRTEYGYHLEEAEKFKKRILNGMLAQTLTTLAALDEHYEEKEPLKPIYEFYCQHRLIKELENRLFRPQVSVTDEEIEKYYNDNLERFSQPEMVSIAVLEDEENLINKMYEEMKRGEDFFDVGRRYYSKESPVKRMPLKNLAAVVQDKLSKMVDGEVSSPITVQGHHAIIKLVSRVPSTAMPFDHVRDKIATLLDKEKFSKARDSYLAQLRNRSVISVNDRSWEKLKKEIGDLHVGKEN